jgi:carboxypeptidase PM20D1
MWGKIGVRFLAMKKFMIVVAGGLAALVLVMVARTALMGGGSETPITRAAFTVYDGDAIAARLGAAIRLQTVSKSLEATPDAEAFTAIAQFLSETYPAAHAVMEREVVGDYSLVYKWPGTDGAKKPTGFIAHLDVVPVETGTEDEWTRPPFSGAVYDGSVWGRGALDNKGQVIALMEAAERLASEGFTPARDIYFLFGHDEELGGGNGAGKIVSHLKARGVSLAWTIDEGSGLAQGIIPGIEKPVALISTAEKGSVTLRFTARGQGGHSSTPAPDTAVSILARAVLAVTDNPYPLKLDDNVVAFLHALAGEMPFSRRLIMANLWLTGPLVKGQLKGDALTAASLHTTTAPTIIKGGEKSNILPQQAVAIVNYRIHPRDNVEAVRARAVRLINDSRVTVEIAGGREPSPQSSASGEGYRAIAATTTAIFGDIVLAPALTLQGTDSRHYADIADDNYRFTPFVYTPDDLQRIHGTDERVKIENLSRAAAWYEALMRRVAG